MKRFLLNVMILTTVVTVLIETSMQVLDTSGWYALHWICVGVLGGIISIPISNWMKPIINPIEVISPKCVYVVQEEDSDGKNSVIGVASNSKCALELLEKFYGKDYRQIDFRDVRDSGLEWTVTVEWVDTDSMCYQSKVWCSYYQVNEV